MKTTRPGRLVAAVVLLATVLAAQQSFADSHACGGRTATIVGTGGDDTLIGTSLPDVITGLGGNDVISGLGGDDLLCGGPGDDQLIGGSGSDRLIGNAGADTIGYMTAPAGVVVNLGLRTATGGAGDDVLQSVERVVGSGFDDTLTGNAKDNFLDGGAGSDELVGRGGDDLLRGGPGDDLLDGRSGDDVLNGGPGRDVASFVHAASGVTADLVAGSAVGDGIDRLLNLEDLRGSRHGDTLRGDGGDNHLAGGKGDDVLAGRGGADRLTGNRGRDSAAGGGGVDLCNAESASGCEDRRSIARQVFNLANAARAAAGRSPLSWDPALAEVAAGHAVDMYVNGFFGHVSPTTGGPADRVDAAGIPWSFLAENLGKGHTTAAAVHTAWMNSPGHRANILSSNASRAGVAVVSGAEGLMTVQLLAG